MKLNLRKAITLTLVIVLLVSLFSFSTATSTTHEKVSPKLTSTPESIHTNYSRGCGQQENCWYKR